MALKTDYKDYIPLGENRVFNIVKPDGTILDGGNGVNLEDVTTYEQEGNTWGATDFNITNTKVNEIENEMENTNTSVTDLKTDLENRGFGQSGYVEYLETVSSMDVFRGKGNGIYLATVADASKPADGFWYFEVNRYSIDTAKIIAREYLGTRIRECYWYAGTWYGWTDLVKATFDGTTLNITL